MFEGKLYAVGGYFFDFEYYYYNYNNNGYDPNNPYDPTLASVETLSSPTGTWVTEANGLNVARHR